MINSEKMANLSRKDIHRLTSEDLHDLGFTAHDIIEISAMTPKARFRYLRDISNKEINEQLFSGMLRYRNCKI